MHKTRENVTIGCYIIQFKKAENTNSKSNYI